jgi:beta-1,4-N-acetylglucosaminyltransferase
MILVTVGMHTQSFDRLVRAAGELAALVDERVIVQRGVSSCVPATAKHIDFVDDNQMSWWIAEARVVVSHAGAGSILGALRAAKPLVLVPRMAHLGEVADDHQFELAGALAQQGQAVMVTDLSAQALAAAIEQAAQLGSVPVGDTGLHAALRDWLTAQAARPPSRRLRLLRRLTGGR